MNIYNQYKSNGFKIFGKQYILFKEAYQYPLLVDKQQKFKDAFSQLKKEYPSLYKINVVLYGGKSLLKEENANKTIEQLEIDETIPIIITHY